MRKKAIFLDRDGVLNEIVYHETEKPSSPWKYEEFKLKPDIEKPLEELVQMGYLLFIISNQPDMARGRMKEGTTEKINEELYKKFPLTEIRVCSHDDRHGCECRKPKPGMILDLCKKWNVDPKKSFVIGDSWKDIDAGKAAKCTTILIEYKYNETVKADYRTEKLKSAVEIIKKLEQR